MKFGPRPNFFCARENQGTNYWQILLKSNLSLGFFAKRFQVVLSNMRYEKMYLLFIDFDPG